MGTSANDLDIGVGLHEIPGSGAVVDALRARLAALKNDLAQAAAAQNAFNGGSGKPAVATAASVAVSAANQAIGAYVRMGQVIDATSEKTVAAFRAEGDALKVDLALLGATDTQLKKIDSTVAQLDQKIGAIHVDNLAAQEGPQRFTEQINAATVALERMGSAVDVTSAESIAAFRKEADALKADLVLMGATEQQIAKIGTTVARLDAQIAARGAKNVPIVPPIPAQTASTFDAIAPRLRTAANAVAILSIAAETGRGSLQGMAVAAGNLTIGIGALLTGPVGGLVVALGAIITLVTTAIGLWKEAQKTLDATTRAQGEANAARLQRLAGEDAARAADVVRQANDAKKAVEEGKGTAKQKADAIAAITREQNEKLATIESDRAKKARDADQRELDELGVLQEKFFLRQAEGAREAVKREFAGRNKALDEEQKKAENDPDPERRQSLLDNILRARDTAARKQRIQNRQIDKDDLEEQKAAQLAANAQLLDLLGQGAAAQRLTIEAQFDALLKSLKEKGVQNAEGIARAIFNAQSAKNAIDEVQRNTAQIFSASDNEIARTNALLNAHQITISQGRERIVAALTAERDAVAANIVKLEALLAAERIAFGVTDPAVAQGIDDAKTKLLELSLLVERTADQFAELKDTARSASETALAGFFEGIAHLGGQDTTQISALTRQITDAQQELTELLAIPAAQRNGETNKRVSDLRAEIEATTVSLENSKSSITTWRDLFVSALKSIADALVRVSSQMLATAIIERLMGLIVGSAVDPTDAIIAKGIPGVQVIGGHARGGLIEGPEGIDVIPGMLTRREFVEPRPSVEHYGVDVFEAMRRRLIPRDAVRSLMEGVRPLTVHTPRTHFNAGGLVESAASARFASNGGGSTHVVEVGLGPGLIAREVKRAIESPDGRDVVIKIVQKNPRQLGLE